MRAVAVVFAAWLVLSASACSVDLTKIQCHTDEDCPTGLACNPQGLCGTCALSCNDGLTCSLATGSQSCGCPPVTDGVFHVNTTVTRADSLAPTGASTPSQCVFSDVATAMGTATQYASKAKDGGATVSLAVATYDLPLPLTIPSGVTLASDQPGQWYRLPAPAADGGAAVLLSPNSGLMDAQLLWRDGGTGIGVAATCTDGGHIFLADLDIEPGVSPAPQQGALFQGNCVVSGSHLLFANLTNAVQLEDQTQATLSDVQGSANGLGFVVTGGSLSLSDAGMRGGQQAVVFGRDGGVSVTIAESVFASSSDYAIGFALSGVAGVPNRSTLNLTDVAVKGSAALRLNNTTVKATNLVVSQSPADAINLTGSSLVLDGGSVSDCGGNGLFADQGSTVEATAAHFDSNAACGATVQMSSQLTLHGGTMSNNVSCGAHLNSQATLHADQGATFAGNASGVLAEIKSVVLAEGVTFIGNDTSLDVEGGSGGFVDGGTLTVAASGGVNVKLVQLKNAIPFTLANSTVTTTGTTTTRILTLDRADGSSTQGPTLSFFNTTFTGGGGLQLGNSALGSNTISVSLDNVTVNDSVQDGVSLILQSTQTLLPPSQLSVTNSTFQGNHSAGLSLTGLTGSNIRAFSGNLFKSNGAYGLQLDLDGQDFKLDTTGTAACAARPTRFQCYSSGSPAVYIANEENQPMVDLKGVVFATNPADTNINLLYPGGAVMPIIVPAPCPYDASGNDPSNCP